MDDRKTTCRAYVEAYHEAMIAQSYTGRVAEEIRTFCVAQYDPDINREAIRSGVYKRMASSNDVEKKTKVWCDLVENIYPERDWTTSRILRKGDVEDLKARVDSEGRRG